MKLDEARDLIAMMHAATGSGRMTGEKQGFWEAQLVHLPADQATEAVLLGIKSWRYFPSWADFGEVYTAVGRRHQQAVEGERRHEHETIVSTRLPVWVKRWAAARMLHNAFGRDRDERRFAEQGDHGDPNQPLMPEDEWLPEAEKIADAQVFAALRTGALVFAGPSSSPS